MKIAIIGAGFGGLSAAYDLLRAGHQVTIFESDTGVGGLAAGFKEAHWEWFVERYYHHFFQSDRALLGLIDDLGWRERVLFPRPLSVMYHDGKFYPFDSIPTALLYPGLGWGIHKVRFGLAGLFLRLTNNWRALEKVTAEEWMIKWAGKFAYQAMWQPLLEGKFGRYYARVNMAWFWARLKVRTTRLGTYRGGFQQFADDLAAHLRSLGGVLRLATPVRRLSLEDNEWRLALDGGEEQFERVLFTASPGLLARLAPQLPPDYLKGLAELKHMGAVVMVLALQQPLSREGYYWFNLPKSAGFPFLALVEHTNFVSAEHFGGDHIVYCGDYLEEDHPYFKMSQDELLAKFVPALVHINPEFRHNWVRKSWLFSTPYAQPVPFVNHSRNIPAVKTPLDGLYFASMSQVYPWDRGTNFAVELGRKAAGMLMADLKTTGSR